MPRGPAPSSLLLDNSRRAAGRLRHAKVWIDHAYPGRGRHTHLQITARDPLDARVHRPCALLELKLAPLHVNLLCRLLLLGELGKHAPRAMLGRHQSQRAHETDKSERDIDA